MMRNSFILRFFALLAGVIVSSCTEDIDFSVDTEVPIVVKCILRRSAKQTLSLYYAGKNSVSLQVPVENAKAVIICDEKKVAEFVKSEGVEWSADFTPDFRKRYTLEITLPDGKTIWAETAFPGNARLAQRTKSLSYENFKKIKEKGDQKIFNAYSYCIEEEGLEESHNAYKLWILWTQVSHLQSCLISDYWWPHMLPGLPPKLSEYVATDHPGADDFNLTEKRFSDLKFLDVPLTLEMEVFITDWQKLCLHDFPLHSKLLRIDHPRNFVNPAYAEGSISSPLDDQRCFILAGELDFESMLRFKSLSPHGELIGPYYWQCFVSDEYDRYLKDVYTKYFNRDNFLLSQYDAENIYTNINGGIGIFGAVHYGSRINSADDFLQEPPI